MRKYYVPEKFILMQRDWVTSVVGGLAAGNDVGTVRSWKQNKSFASV
ncbi:hypothetical protein [Heliobacterium mobile]|nr:hypothetical protein [Heliobacterium mobile]